MFLLFFSRGFISWRVAWISISTIPRILAPSAPSIHRKRALPAARNERPAHPDKAGRWRAASPAENPALSGELAASAMCFKMLETAGMPKNQCCQGLLNSADFLKQENCLGKLVLQATSLHMIP